LFRFEHPFWFLAAVALPLLAALYFFAVRQKKLRMAKLGDPSFINALARSYSPKAYLFKAVLGISALVMLILALANPQVKGKSGQFNRQGLDVILIMDVSKSMLAEDLKPNRLERARQLMSLLIDRLSDNRLGLIWFAGRAYLQMPLTTDLSAAKLYLQTAGPDAVPTQGTVIGEALKLAGTAFNTQENKYKAIILISDGEDHDPEALEVVKRLVQSGVMINTVGVGSPEGSSIYDPATGTVKKDAAGNTVISKLNEEQLRSLALQGNGTYVFLQDPGAAAATLKEQLDTIEKKQLEDANTIQYNSYFYWFLILALGFLAAEIFISERKTSIA
jgi:Ca-activated chloride channel family protein